MKAMQTFRGLSCLLLPVLSAGVLSAQTEAGKIQERSYEFKEAGREIDYTLYVPRSYKKSRKAPLLVLLHGLGSNPDQVIRYEGITDEAEERGYLVVAPYGYNERGWYGSQGKGKGNFLGGRPEDPENLGELSEKDVLNVLGIVRKEFNIDPQRIYLAGHSMGGGGTIYLGAAHSGIWAALAPMSPAYMGSRDILEKIKAPVMIVTGEKDTVVPVQMVRPFVQRMKELKMNHIYKEIPGGNHGPTIHNNPGLMAEVFDFFDGNSLKKEHPAESVKEAFRTFTNKGGRTITARIVSSRGEKVTIARKDGKTFVIPISSLSEADQDYVARWAEKEGP